MKKFIKRFILFILILGIFFVCYYTYFLSPDDYYFAQYQYESTKISSKLDGCKIAFISDINLTEEQELTKLNQAIKELNQYPFDMIIFGGDLYDGNVFNAKKVSSALKKISCKYGKFAVLGDKDKQASKEITQILNNGGFEVINNENRTLYYKETTFQLICCSQNKDISKLKIKDNNVNICITHQPDSFIQHQGKIDLQISGHSYGGGIYIPLYGPLTLMDGARAYNHGTYEQGASTLLVSNGFSGPASSPYKFFSRNQINFITLKTSTKNE